MAATRGRPQRAAGLWGLEADLAGEWQVVRQEVVAQGFGQAAGEVLRRAEGFGQGADQAAVQDELSDVVRDPQQDIENPEAVSLASHRDAE